MKTPPPIGNLPSSNTVPAIKDSSESCSALQAYSARAFRSGGLEKIKIYRRAINLLKL